MTFLLF